MKELVLKHFPDAYARVEFGHFPVEQVPFVVIARWKNDDSVQRLGNWFNVEQEDNAWVSAAYCQELA